MGSQHVLKNDMSGRIDILSGFGLLLKFYKFSLFLEWLKLSGVMLRPASETLNPTWPYILKRKTYVELC